MLPPILPRVRNRHPAPPYQAAVDALMNREIDNRREDVQKHEDRVANMARKLAREVGYPREDLELLYKAACVHDIGKLEIPDKILNKVEKFTDAEYTIMRSHARIGSDMLKQIPGLPPIYAEIARYHHERYDGHGYENKSDESIPYAARIVAIADVHDALCEKRVYKPAVDEEVSLGRMIADNVGDTFGRRAFDPFLLRKFVAMRMRDPKFECSEAGRAHFAEFAASNPMDDLSEEMRSRIQISPDGHRRVQEERNGQVRVYEVDPSGFIDIQEANPEFDVGEPTVALTM